MRNSPNPKLSIAPYFRWTIVVVLLAFAIGTVEAQQTSTSDQTNQSSSSSTQNASSAPSTTQSGAQSPTQQQQQQQQPDVSGPQSDTTPMIIRKKDPNAEQPKPEPPPEKPKKIDQIPEATFRVESALVNVDVSVLTKDGQFIPGLKQGNFKVFEDNVPQAITNFSQSEKPITAVMLLEFGNIPYQFNYDMLTGAYTFVQTLKKEDYIAVVDYDMKPHMLVDFTQDKRAIQGALNELRIPGFSETNLFDALYDTIDRLERVEGHKYIILMSRGLDTFSKLNLDKVTKKVKGAKDITIYAISTGQALRLMAEARGWGNTWTGEMAQMDYLQADNQMKTFAKLTGGKAYFPRFEGEFPEIFGDIAQTIRQQYTLAYHPSNSKLDGTYRKLKVELVGPDGGPLKIVDQHGKTVKYEIIARDGYTAKRTVE